MKRARYIFISLQFSVFSLLQAQSYVGPSIGGNFVHVVDNLQMTQSRLSGGGEAGIAYEWQREHLIVRTGINYSLQCPSMAVDSQWLEQEMLDTRGVPFTYRGLLAQRTDRMNLHQLTVPLMIGGSWYGLYILAGVKMSVFLHATARQEAQLRTAGDYQGRYYDWFENMPNHGYHDFEPVESTHALQLQRFDVRLAAEMGYTISLNRYTDHRPPSLLRMGVFTEYGLLNLHSGNNTEPRTRTDWSQYLHVDMTHLYGSEESNASRANLFIYGVRLTLLLPVSGAPERKYNCLCEGIW